MHIGSKYKNGLTHHVLVEYNFRLVSVFLIASHCMLCVLVSIIIRSCGQEVYGCPQFKTSLQEETCKNYLKKTKLMKIFNSKNENKIKSIYMLTDVVYDKMLISIGFKDVIFFCCIQFYVAEYRMPRNLLLIFLEKHV